MKENLRNFIKSLRGRKSKAPKPSSMLQIGDHLDPPDAQEGQVLVSQGAGKRPTWETITDEGSDSVIDAAGWRELKPDLCQSPTWIELNPCGEIPLPATGSSAFPLTDPWAKSHKRAAEPEGTSRMNAKWGLSKPKPEVSDAYLEALQAAYDKGLIKLNDAVKALGGDFIPRVTNIEVTTKDDVIHCEATIRFPLTRIVGTFIITDLPPKSELPWDGWPLGKPDE